MTQLALPVNRPDYAPERRPGDSIDPVGYVIAESGCRLDAFNATGCSGRGCVGPRSTLRQIPDRPMKLAFRLVVVVVVCAVLLANQEQK